VFILREIKFFGMNTYDVFILNELLFYFSELGAPEEGWAQFSTYR